MRKLLSALFVLVSLVSGAQNVAIIGYVYGNDTKQPLSLCAVQVKNSQLGALTEDNGFFDLPIPTSNLTDSLKISFIGYLPKAISVAGYKHTDIIIGEAEDALNRLNAKTEPKKN